MKVQVNAKLNLTLNVLGAVNGFHLIDSLATSIDVYDEVDVAVRKDKCVTVRGVPSVEDGKNTAYRAACAFIDTFDCNGVDIVINKRIPIGAGMGGSSADAAAVVYCMCRLFERDVNSPQIRDICKAIGSDVSFMLRGGLGRLRGKGNDVEFYSLGKPLYFALTKFNCSVLSRDAYGRLETLGISQACADNAELLNMLQSGNVLCAVKGFNNHLQKAVVDLSGYAYDYMRFCLNCGLPFNMTGSGSAFYGAFDSEQAAASAAALLNGNGFNTTVCKSAPLGITEA